MSYAVLLGRLCLSAIFIASGVSHFSASSIEYAAGFGVSAPLVMASGLLAAAGGLMVALGWNARAGAWAIVLFLVPVTLVMHRFWGLDDPQTAMLQRVQFMKNLSMLGGALLVAYFGAGPWSLDNRRLLDPASWLRERRKEPAER